LKNPETPQDNSRFGPILMSQKTILARVQELGSQISKDYLGKKLHLIGILKGASIFHADLVRAINLETTYDFMAVGSYGAQTHSTGIVRMLKDLDESPEGKDVLLVEDIVDTGLTLQHLKQNLQARFPKSLKTAALLSKPSRRVVDVSVEYVGFEIPNTFVVGYGLDYNQRYRNLPDIHFLKGESSNEIQIPEMI
jgi:hypoxanthine phosphoribosyltransferase